MKLRLLTVMLSVMLGFMPLSAVRLDPESHAYLSDPKYEKHIDVQCYLVTREQLGKLFSQPGYKIEQLPNNKIASEELYLFVRCKNSGRYAAFGEILCFIPNRGSPISVDVTDLHANATFYNNGVIYVGRGLIEQNDDLPQIKYEWDCLYTM